MLTTPAYSGGMTANNAPISVHSALWRYWDGQRAGRPMPARKDVAPEAIHTLLPYVSLIEIEGERFKYRLVGTNITESLGREMTGTYVGSHLPPAHASAMLAAYRRACETRQPVFTSSRYERADRASQRVSRIILPLGSGDTVAMLLCSRISRYADWSEGTDWFASASSRMEQVHDVASLAELEALAEAWDQANPIEAAPALAR
jgi:hypothetical protein